MYHLNDPTHAMGHRGCVRIVYIGSAADGFMEYLYILTYFVILILNITNAQKIYNL